MEMFTGLRANRTSVCLRHGRGLAAALSAVLALGALLAASASGAPLKLDLTWDFEDNQLAPGQTFAMALGSSVINEDIKGPLMLATDPGNVTCDPTEAPWSGLEGVDQTNDEVTDKLEMTGAYSDGDCLNTTGLGSTAQVDIFAEGAILNLNGGKFKAELKAKTGRPIDLDVFYSGGDVCVYTATKLKGSLKLEPEGFGNQLDQTYTNQKVKFLKADSSAACPKKVALSAPFYFAIGGEGASLAGGYYVYGHVV